MLLLNPRKVFLFLLGCIAVLLLLHCISYYDFYVNDGGTKDFFFRKTNFATEKNAPSIFSSIQIFFASILLFTIAFGKLSIKKSTFLWMTLSVLFLFLGLDELLRLHEKVGRFTAKNVETSGIFYYSWVIPYALGLIVLAVLLIKPLFKLPKKTLYHFITAGVIFISGALLLEMAAGWYIENVPDWYVEGEDVDAKTLHRTIPIFIMYTIEELLEKIGIAYFIFGILKFKKEYQLVSR